MFFYRLVLGVLGFEIGLDFIFLGGFFVSSRFWGRFVFVGSIVLVGSYFGVVVVN